MNRREFITGLGIGAAALASLPRKASAGVESLTDPANSPLASATDPIVVDPSGTPLPSDLCAAMRRVRSEHPDLSGRTLLLGGHEWNLFPEEANEGFLFPCNNEAGMVKTPFLLEGISNLVIDGQGARLLVRGTPQSGSGSMAVIHTPLVPFVLKNCHNVVLKNFSVDWATPGTVQGLCVAVDADKGSFDVQIEPGRRVWCWNGQLFLVGEGWTWPVHRLLMADPQTGAIAHGCGDNMGAGFEVAWHSEMLSENRVRITGPKTARVSAGALILGWGTTYHTGARRAPSMALDACENVAVENVTLHYAWAMGVIAQASTHLSFSNFVVEPSGDRKYSLAADGAHFVNCRGRLQFTSCRFQNQFDDAINTHGLYHQVVRVLGSRKVRIRAVHPQHQGVNVHRPGDQIRFCTNRFMAVAGEVPLVRADRVNSEFIDLTLAGDIPLGIAAGDFTEIANGYPEIFIRDCTIRWNRARGVLVNGRGPIHIENNHFETAGAAVMVESSGMWGEAGPIQEMRIAGNTFTRCAHVPDWGKAVIQASPEFREHADTPAGLKPFHGKLVVEKNTFSECYAPSVKATSFESVVSDVLQPA